jgi:hypothetical protein
VARALGNSQLAIWQAARIRVREFLRASAFQETGIADIIRADTLPHSQK